MDAEIIASVVQANDILNDLINEDAQAQNLDSFTYNGIMSAAESLGEIEERYRNEQEK